MIQETKSSNTCNEGIPPKGPYLPCVSMAGRALLAGYHLQFQVQSNRITKQTFKDMTRCQRLTHEVCSIGLCCNLWWFRDQSLYGFSQWETTLHYNVVSHCLDPYTEWSLRLNYRHRNTHTWMIQKLESILDVYVNVATVAAFLLFIFSWSFLLVFMKLYSE